MATTSGFDSVAGPIGSALTRHVRVTLVEIGLLLAVFTGFLINAMVQPRMFFDLSLMKKIQAVDIPRVYEVTQFINRDLTSSRPAVMSWLVLMSVLASVRWWSAFLTAGLMPAGGIVSEFISGVLVTRTRPHLDELVRTSVDMEERSFPSGHVVGAVLFYGLIFVLLRRIRWHVIRYPLQAVCLGIIAMVGFGRIWAGAHWPSDVISAYPLGLAMLLALVSIFNWLESDGLAKVQQRVRQFARPDAA